MTTEEMNREKAKVIMECRRPSCGRTPVFTEEELCEAYDLAIEALDMVEEFEKAQIITGGRLNGRTYAQKCGLEDGKRKALEQEPVLDKIRAEIEPKCDRINSLASVLPYTAHREIQELLCEIMDWCKAESEDKE